MDEHDWLAERFEENRTHLRAVAYRMLGSLSEADDAVQEAWLRLSPSDASGVENLGGWLTTVIARVCLDTLAPAERLVFVLHDIFAVPFDEIAPIVGRSPTAARQLASRARRRVQGAVLDPDVVLRVDRGAVPRGASRAVRGATAVAKQGFTFSGLGWFAQPAHVNGAAGVVVTRRGRPFAVMGVTVRRGKIVAIDILADPARLRQLDLAVLNG